MENIDNRQNEEDNQNSSNKRSRRTPSKFGNYFEFEEVVEEEEKEEADEDDSDEDPSWDDKKGVKNSFSKGYVPPEEEDDDDDQDFSDADEDEDDSKRKKGRGRGRGSMVNVRGRGRGTIPNSGVILNNSRGVSYGGPPQAAQAPSHAKPLPPNLSTIPPHLMGQMRPVMGQQGSTMMGMSGMTAMGQQSGGPIIHDSRIASIQRDSTLQQIFNAQQQQKLQQQQSPQQNSMNWRGYPISVTNGPSMTNLPTSTSTMGQQSTQQQQQQMGQYRSMTPEQQMKMQNDIRYQEMYRQQVKQLPQQQQQMMQQYQTSNTPSSTTSSSSFDPNSILSNPTYSRNYYGSSDTTTSTNSGNNSITSNTSVSSSVSNSSNTVPGSNFVPFKLPQFGNPTSTNSSLGSELYRQPSPQPQSSTTTTPGSTSNTNSTSPTLNYNKATGQTPSPPLLSTTVNAQNSNAPKSGIFDSLFSQWNQSGSGVTSGSNNSSASSNNRMNPLRFSNDPLATINSFFSDEETSGIDMSTSSNSTSGTSATSNTTSPTSTNTMDTTKSGYGNLIPPPSNNPSSISFPTTTSGIPPSYLTGYTGPSTTPASASSLLSSNRGYPASNSVSSIGGTSNLNMGATSTNSAYTNNIPGSVNNYSRYPNNVPGFLYPYGNTGATSGMRNPNLPQQQQQQGGWSQMNNPNLMRTTPQLSQQQDLYQRNLAYRPPLNIPGYPGPLNISGIPPEHLIQDKEEEEEEDVVDEDEDEDPDVDPQEKKLNTLVKQCEQYATQIRDVVGHWQEKSLGSDKEMKGSILEENPEEVQNLELIKQPEMLAHELRSYQLVGLNWLYLLHQQKINGILADEMGLGKTIQTISFFALLKEKVDMKKPHLVIVPATALENWVREFAEWCPSFKVEMYHGSAKDRETLRKKLQPKDGKYDFDVLITTYNLCVNKVDRVKFFKKFDFGYIVLDEAHNIKNVSSLRYQSLVKLAFRAEFRLMLTGTPLQNNLNELWALLNFLMPNIFGDTKEFKDLLWPEDDEHNNENNIEVQRLKRILSPFLLRRLKSEVLTKLPEKTEKLVWCGFTPFQRELYEKTYQSSRTKYHNYAIKAEENREFRERREKGNNSDDDDLEVINQANSFKSEGKEPLEEKTLHHILMQLRKAANNALLFRHYYDDEKIDQITQILREEELNKAAKSEEENANLTKKRKVIPEENSSKKVKTENGGEEENKEEEAEEEESTNTEGVNPLTNTNGEECGVCGEIGNLLLCDGPCIRGFHLKCIGLEAQPESDKWYCDDCDYLVKDSTLLDAPATDDQDKYVAIIEAVENCQDKKGRYKSELFIYLPAKREYPDYYEIIKSPISLHMLKRRHYQSREHFRDEFFQLVKNAHTYNTPNSQVYRDANSLEKVFRKEFTNYFGSELLPAPTTSARSTSSTTSTSHATLDTFDYSELELEALFEDIDDDEDDDEDKPTKKRKKSSSRSKKNSNADNEDLESLGIDSSSHVPSVSRRTRSRRGQSSNNTSDDFPMALLEETTTRRKSSRNASSNTTNKNKTSNSNSNNSNSIRKAKLSEPFLTCRNILEDFMDQDDAIPFNAPVDANITPDYYKIVKTPMDFGTVWSKLNRKEYSSPEEFIDDVRLVFDNCLLYNAPSSQIGLVAQQLWSFFKRQCKKQGIKVDSNVILLHKKMKSEDLSTLPDELKLKSDMEIHQFCKSYDSLKHLCLPDDQLFHSSGKLEALKKKLLKFHTKQNRVLIFSQFTQILNILEDFLARLGFKFLRLDGSTPVLERQLMIDDFNHNRDIFVFLLSTRAGGLGINLTSADVCIFHDIDWNPEMDRQAEARIHRIGQMKPVKIVKLLTKDTVDEYIYRMAQNKKERNDLIMSENDKVITEEKLSIAQVLSSIFTQPETAKIESITDPKTE